MVSLHLSLQNFFYLSTSKDAAKCFFLCKKKKNLQKFVKMQILCIFPCHYKSYHFLRISHVPDTVQSFSDITAHNPGKDMLLSPFK